MDADEGRVQPLKDRMTRDVRTVLWVLLAAVGFVLLIAVANMASLLEPLGLTADVSRVIVQPTASSRAAALRFLEENRAKPFFCGLSIRKPHFPFAVQRAFYDLYKDRIDVPRTAIRSL